MRTLSHNCDLWRKLLISNWGLTEKPSYITWRTLYSAIVNDTKHSVWTPSLHGSIERKGRLCAGTLDTLIERYVVVRSDVAGRLP